MKSTQDLCIWLNAVEQHLEIGATDKMLSIEIFADKSFRINKHNHDKVETVYDSDELEHAVREDINDLPYRDPFVLALEIKDIISEKKKYNLGDEDVL